MTGLISGHDVAISYIPPFLHPQVAKACLAARVHLVTASYISPEMKELDAEAKEKGLIFINEVGLDPGIDIMSTMKVKDEVEEAGGKIVGYESWCGGLPDAINADNPLGYKFSWAPQAVFTTSKNQAVFLKDGEVVTIEGPELMTTGTTAKNVHMAYKIECYPNRDSISFKESFGFKDARSFVRGTLRYEGFSYIIRALHQIGITDSTELDHDKHKTIKDVTLELADESPAHSQIAQVDDFDFGSEENQALAKKLLNKCSEEDPKRVRDIIKSWLYFELFSDIPLNGKGKNYLDAFCNACGEKLWYKDGEKDMVLMKHIFTIVDSSG